MALPLSRDTSASALTHASVRRSLSAGGTSLRTRLLLWLGVLAAEYVPVELLPHAWLFIVYLLAPVIVFLAVVFSFGWRRFPPGDAPRIDRRFLALHIAALIALVFIERVLLRSPRPPSHTVPPMVRAWYGSIFVMVVSLLLALVPWPALVRLARALADVLAYAFAASIAAILCAPYLRSLWFFSSERTGHVLQAGTFAGVRWILQLFYTGVVSLPALSTVGTARFQVEILQACSGMEGLGLMFVLTTAWLVFARRELNLRRALLLVPCSLALVWLLNMVRIAALIAIGDAGHEDVAVHGFHSEAGWILFNGAALVFLVAAQHVAWFRKDAAPSTGRNIAAIYVLPFLAVLAASLFTHAASSSFDWLYPLRLPAALLALWPFRKDYRRMDWRFGWLGPTAGAAVFLLWLLFARWTGGTSPLAEQLYALPAAQRILWTVARAAAAVITVPIVEELAFRGYIARRLVSADVEAVPYTALTVPAILVSSLAFGLLHGPLWIAGTLAGIAFALVARARNRIGEAVAAHAMANLLIAVWVLTRGDYSLW